MIKCIAAVFFLSAGCSLGAMAQDNTLTAAEKRAGWKLLFDGKSTAGWHTYKQAPDDSWEITNGELHCKQEGVQHRADLVTNGKYENFELELDWKIEKGANSGVLYHVVETHEHPYETGPEYQLIDDFGYPGKLEEWQKSGADYAMHPPLKIATRPQGEYNHTRIVVKGDHVEHWLNGFKVVEYELGSADWDATVKASKFAKWPNFAKSRRGRRRIRWNCSTELPAVSRKI